jgi:cytochrome P450
MTDMEQMPYICALMKEVLRWRPIFPFTPDHVLTSDMEFEGYNFPASVGFVINGIAVCNECEDPDTFKPERWLDGHEADAWLKGIHAPRKGCTNEIVMRRETKCSCGWVTRILAF